MRASRLPSLVVGPREAAFEGAAHQATEIGLSYHNRQESRRTQGCRITQPHTGSVSGRRRGSASFCCLRRHYNISIFLPALLPAKRIPDGNPVADSSSRTEFCIIVDEIQTGFRTHK